MVTVGMVVFWIILGGAFWGIIFVLAVVLPYLLKMYTLERFAPKLAEKLTFYSPEEIAEIKAGKWSSRRPDEM